MARMRLLLIANTQAQTVTARKVRFIERALASRAKVELVRTERQGHAAQLARDAEGSGMEAVAVLGGDGTVNEVVNGLAETSLPVGLIPGGGTNVFARSLGIPRDAVRAAGHLLARLEAPPRQVNLGRAAARRFTFTCGIGLDGEIVRRVERRQALKQAGGHGYFVWSALRTAMASYDLGAPRVRLRWGDELEHEASGLGFAIAQNSAPFTYLLGRAMQLCPDADVSKGLDCFGARGIGRLRMIKVAIQAFSTRRHVQDPRAVYVRDQPRIQVTCTEPLPVQMDGEYIGLHDELVLESLPGALAVFA